MIQVLKQQMKMKIRKSVINKVILMTQICKNQIDLVH